MSDSTNKVSFGSEKLKEYQESIISASYKVKATKSDKDKKEKEIVNIVSDYQWLQDKMVKKQMGVYKDMPIPGKVPVCYVNERKSAVNAGVAGILNALLMVQTGVDKSANTVSNLLKDVNDTLAKSIEEAGVTANNAIAKVLQTLLPDKAENLLKENNLPLGTGLGPYAYLYITKPTNKGYVFPLVNNSASFGVVNGNWGSSYTLPGLAGQAIEWLNNTFDGVSGLNNLISNINSFTSGNGGDIGNHREMSKTYSFPQTGDKVTSTFTLYNTTKTDAWKENYKFLFYFIIRNLPMRIDVSSFVPPLLYDVFIPGVKHLPVCCVENISVKPLGMIRTLNCQNFLVSGKKDTMPFSVPEAWEVSITFGSLIAPSMNLMLSAGGFETSIVVDTVGEGGKKEGEAKTGETNTGGTNTGEASNDKSQPSRRKPFPGFSW